MRLELRDGAVSQQQPFLADAASEIDGGIRTIAAPVHGNHRAEPEFVVVHSVADGEIRNLSATTVLRLHE